MKSGFNIYPIGVIHKTEASCRIEILEPYTDAMVGLDRFSHIDVYFWFHRNDTPEQRSILRIHPRKNPENPLTGVFATHAPVRPNLIGHTVCRILSIAGNTIVIDDIDAFDRSPLIDIKAYFPQDPKTEIKTADYK